MRRAHHRLHCALLSGLLLAVAGPGAAEIYRWRDAAGREHFTTDLQQVPAAKRRQALEKARSAQDGPPVNYHSQPRQAPAAPRAQASPGGGGEAVDYDCDALRKQARALLEKLTRQERVVAQREDSVSDISSSIYAEHMRKKSLAKAETEFEALRDDYERWRGLHLRRRAPPGCLR